MNNNAHDTPTLWPSGHRYGGSAMLKGEREAWELGFRAGQDDAARQINAVVLRPPTDWPSVYPGDLSEED